MFAAAGVESSAAACGGSGGSGADAFNPCKGVALDVAALCSLPGGRVLGTLSLPSFVVYASRQWSAS